MDIKYETVHRPGVTHQATDTLSSMPTRGDDQTPLNEVVPLFSIMDQTDVQDEEESVLYAV